MTAPILSMAPGRRSWPLGVVTALLLAACATPQPRQEPGTIDIGYGSVGTESVDGSVERLEPDEEGLERTRLLADMLRRVAGVQVAIRGDHLVVRIRGASSFLASQEPLVVLDGMEYRGALRAINPAAIESIRVLKNAGETGVYGSRGGNGVILITTKMGIAAVPDSIGG